MGGYNRQLDDPVAVETAYERFTAVARSYEADLLAEIDDVLGQLPYRGEVPGCEYGTSHALGVLRVQVAALMDEDTEPVLDQTDRSDIGKVQRVIEAEYQRLRDIGYQERRI